MVFQTSWESFHVQASFRKIRFPRRHDRCCTDDHHVDGICRRDHQGRHPALAVRHHGHQRDHAERRHADAGRRAEQEGRFAGQEARSGGGRPGLRLAAVRRKGARADGEGKGRRGLRLLDLGVAQVRAAGVRRAERYPVLSGAVRGRGKSSATSSTPAPRRTSRRSRRWTT
jgi:hypothetical protein